jgi:hypothetical protein
MATQRFALARFPQLNGRPQDGKRRPPESHHRGRGVWMAVLFLSLVFVLGAQAQPAAAAAIQPLKCPMYAGNGAAHCNEAKVTSLSPSPLSLKPTGGGSISEWDRWTICVSTREFEDIFTAGGDPRRIFIFEEHILTEDNNDWDGNWTLGMYMSDFAGPQIYYWEPYGVSKAVEMGDKANWPTPRPECPPPAPPCVTCTPVVTQIVLNSSFDFWTYTPNPAIDGEAACPPDSPAGSWCPPTVGNPVTLWVSEEPRGDTEDCGELDNYLGLYTRLDVCMRWLRASDYTWNFDDEHVNPSTGQGQRTPTVTSVLDEQVTHTFEYSSAYDPIDRCTRPCSGDLKGPPAPGYPNGTPAFQVTVASTWILQIRQRATLEGNTGPWSDWETVDLRDFGAPASSFTSVTTLPLFVLSYGSVTS